MKTVTRIATALTAAVLSIFIASPAFAAGDVEKFNPADQFSAAGQPVDTVAILIVGAVLLVVVLGASTLLGNLFEKKQ